MSTLSGVGRFVSWTGGCLLIGRSAAVIPEHAHYAIQIAFGSTPGIRFQTAEEWTEYTGVLIPSRQPHAMDATGVEMSAVLLIEPETPQGRALTRRYLQHGIAVIPEGILGDLPSTLFSASTKGDPPLVLVDVCQRLLAALTNGIEQPIIADERVVRAIAYINANLGAPLTLERVASEACLSPSRFRHLFVEETGMAFRPYVLWRRFVHVWELITTGTSLSTAAHSAGFADAAHLTRTSRSMFGFPPSALHIMQQRPTAASPAGSVGHSVFPARSTSQPLHSIPHSIPRVT
jgi:AraC family transcriptional regulator